MSALAYVFGRLVVLTLFTLLIRRILVGFMVGPRLVWTTVLSAYFLATISIFAKAKGVTNEEFMHHAVALAVSAVIVILAWFAMGKMRNQLNG